MDAAEKAVADQKLPNVELPIFRIEVPADRTHGDYAVNAAMVWAKPLHMAPRFIAEILVPYFDFHNTYINSCEIAGPGFINFFINQRFYSDILKHCLRITDDLILVKGSAYWLNLYLLIRPDQCILVMLAAAL